MRTFQNDKGIFSNLIDSLPYPIQVYAFDGTSVMVNKALLEEFNISNPDKIVGKYNIFNDVPITTAELVPLAKRVFNGESFSLFDIKVPLEDIVLHFGSADSNIEAMFLDITIFPIFDKDGRILYGAAMLIVKRKYCGKKEIERAKEYIETHCLEDFNIDAVAKASYLSKTHLTRLFKQYTGTTPNKFYMACKFNQLQEKLLDLNLSVAQVFDVCGLNYNGHFAKVFKEKTGLSPSQYRKTKIQT